MENSNATSSISDQHKYYSKRWGDFEYADQLDLKRLVQVLKWAMEIDLPRHFKVLDFGCGAGWSTNILGMFGEATGVDLADTAIPQARYPHCRFLSADVIKWDAPQFEFDLVVSMEVLEHIEEPAQGYYLGIARRVLKPGGHLILTTPNKRTMDAIRGGGRTWSNQPIENWLDMGQLTSLLNQNGFEVRLKTSMSLGVASLGSYRLVNSFKVNKFMQALGVHRIWQGLACWANYGMHLAVLARKKNS